MGSPHVASMCAKHNVSVKCIPYHYAGNGTRTSLQCAQKHNTKAKCILSHSADREPRRCLNAHKRWTLNVYRPPMLIGEPSCSLNTCNSCGSNVACGDSRRHAAGAVYWTIWEEQAQWSLPKFKKERCTLEEQGAVRTPKSQLHPSLSRKRQ